MVDNTLIHTVEFFHALADPNRLKIVGLLAHRPHSVEELAANIGITSATVSHHLQKLQRADLVEARVEQYYNVYALRADVLRQRAAQMANADWIHTVVPHLDLHTYSRNVLAEYFVRGRLKEIPSQLKRREIVLHRLAQEFEPGKRYSKKRIDEILKEFYADTATLRRALVNHKLIVQDNKSYYRNDPATK